MKRYEGLVILKNTVRDEALKDLVDKISADITAQGGKVETVQKMDRRSFSRVSDRRHTSGFYVNYIFEAPPTSIAPLRHRLGLNEDVFRTSFTLAGPAKEQAAAPAQ